MINYSNFNTITISFELNIGKLLIKIFYIIYNKIYLQIKTIIILR